jgi:hypothetical protein
MLEVIGGKGFCLKTSSEAILQPIAAEGDNHQSKEDHRDISSLAHDNTAVMIVAAMQ